jgi:hypothetical protein
LGATLRRRVDARETVAAFADELDTTDGTRRLRTAIGASTPPGCSKLRRAARCAGLDVLRDRLTLAAKQARARPRHPLDALASAVMALEDLIATASEAPAARRLRGFVEWVGEGRPLTQTGRLRRADALALVDLLDTGDRLDPRFPIHSSAELYRLTLVVEWAKACRLVRVVHGRLVPVRKAAKLLDRPLELVAHMLEALPRLGDELGDSVVAFDAAHTSEAVFGELAGRGGSLSTERACEVAWQTATAHYWFPQATEQQLEWQRRGSDGDLRRLLATAAELGVLTVRNGTIELTGLGRCCVPAWLGLGTPEARVLTVKVTLEDSAAPVVWRRLRVAADIRLDRFHQVLGAAMGWDDSHLHVFERGDERYGHPNLEIEIEDDREKTLGDLLAVVGDPLHYEYDFGDSWRHVIVLEASAAGDDPAPRCIDGAGRCPPEDVGGISGYEELRRVLAVPRDAEHEHTLEWLGISDALEFDAAAFDLERANAAIAGAVAARVT